MKYKQASQYFLHKKIKRMAFTKPFSAFGLKEESWGS